MECNQQVIQFPIAMFCLSVKQCSFVINLLKPTVYVMHQQFNIQQL